MEEVIALLTNRGWVASGHTPSEMVRVPTQKSPVFGGVGGELRSFGGRLRFAKDDRRVTVGKRTVCFYKIENGTATCFENIKTKDADAIFARS